MRQSIIDYVFADNERIMADIPHTVEYNIVYEKEEELYNKIMAELDEEHKNLFDSYSDVTAKLEALTEDIFFKAGLKIGMRLAFECFCDK